MADEIKAAVETAIAPEFNIGEINEQASGEVEAQEDTEGVEIASLKNNKGWIEIEAYIDGRIKELSDFDVVGLKVEDIGYRYALESALRKELESIKNIVDMHYEWEKGKREKGEQKEGT